jgi:hypothetical protein
MANASLFSRSLPAIVGASCYIKAEGIYCKLLFFYSTSKGVSGERNYNVGRKKTWLSFCQKSTHSKNRQWQVPPSPRIREKNMLGGVATVPLLLPVVNLLHLHWQHSRASLVQVGTHTPFFLNCEWHFRELFFYCNSASQGRTWPSWAEVEKLFSNSLKWTWLNQVI